jgi:hypothetical protein
MVPHPVDPPFAILLFCEFLPHCPGGSLRVGVKGGGEGGREGEEGRAATTGTVQSSGQRPAGVGTPASGRGGDSLA